MPTAAASTALSATLSSLEELCTLARNSRRLVVLTGAGVSTGSGIPDYRDEGGNWKRKPPMRFQEFVGSESARRRYWARAMVGWRTVREASPNRAHRALSDLERIGLVRDLITQNVDRLHQRAGSRRVLDLHGRIDLVRCLACDDLVPREEHQSRLEEENPGFRTAALARAPDGDADLDRSDYESFRLPACRRCSGVLKPDVVFFGESVPRDRVADAMARVDGADLLLAAGTSLMVWSGYRFVRRALERGIPVVSLNLGRTRADGEAALRLRVDCGEALAGLARALSTAPARGAEARS